MKPDSPDSSKLNSPLFGFLVSTAIFALANMPFKYWQFLPTYADFRISAFYPVTAGLFFGPWGALGCAVGNLIADLFGTLNFESPIGMLANFLFAWLPYRLWHTILPLDHHKAQFISSTKTLVKYLFIASFATASSMGFLSASCELLGFFDFVAFYRPVFLCNLYFALFMGTTFFLLAARFSPVSFYLPQNLYASEYRHKYYLVDYVLCAAIIGSIILRCALGDRENSLVYPVFFADLVITASVLILAALPLRRGSSQGIDGISNGEPLKLQYSDSLQTRIVTAFFIVISANTLYLIFILLNKLAALYDGAQYAATVVPAALRMAGILGLVSIFVLVIVLSWIEKKISSPIVKLAELSNKFVESGLRAEIPNYSALSGEIAALARSYQKMSADIISYVSAIEAHAKREEREKAALETAARIQLGALPKPLDDENFSLASFIRPARTVGGDFYYYVKLDSDRLLICIADVSSKGIPAAIFASEACMLVKVNRELPLEKAIAKINDELWEVNDEDMFVTMFAGVIDRKKRRLEFVNAGHNPPLIRKENSIAWLHSEPDLALGIFPNMAYHLNSVDIDGTFQILLYTDGATEAENIEGAFFGDERLKSLCESLNHIPDGSAKIAAILNSIESFAKGSEQSDDIALLMADIRQ